MMKSLSMVLAIGFVSFDCTQGAASVPTLQPQPAATARLSSLFGGDLASDTIASAARPGADFFAAATLANSVAHPWYDWTSTPITFASEPAEFAFWMNVGVLPGGPAASALQPGSAAMAPGAALQPSRATMLPGGPAAPSPPVMAPSLPAMAPAVEPSIRPDTWETQADQALVERARAALQANLLTSLPGRNVHLAARDGVLTVTGEVRYRRQRLNILDVARSVAGEGMVRNELSAVRHGPPR